MLLLENFLKSNVALKTEYCLNGKNISTRKFIIIQQIRQLNLVYLMMPESFLSIKLYTDALRIFGQFLQQSECMLSNVTIQAIFQQQQLLICLCCISLLYSSVFLERLQKYTDHGIHTNNLLLLGIEKHVCCTSGYEMSKREKIPLTLST